MAKMVICATPLVKWALPQFFKELMEDPMGLSDHKTPFTFDVPRPSGAFKITFNKPVEIASDAIFNWITGGLGGREYLETDAYGCVPYEPKIDLVARLDEMARLEAFIMEDEDAGSAQKAQKELTKLRADSKTSMLEARSGARAASEARVMRAIRTQRRNLERQWQMNEQMKLGREPMSTSEYLGSIILEPEIQKMKTQATKINERMTDSFSTQLPG